MYASERARLLFGQYRKGEANDPDTYVASVAAVLADYPSETIRYVTDPRTGISSRGKFRSYMPNPGEVKGACEDHYGPTRYAIESEKAAQKQLAERERMAPRDDKPRMSYAQIQAMFAEHGFYIGPKGRPADVVNVAEVREKLGISKAQWDAIPDQPPNFPDDLK